MKPGGVGAIVRPPRPLEDARPDRGLTPNDTACGDRRIGEAIELEEGDVVEIVSTAN